MPAKTLFSGTTHNVSGPNGFVRSIDGFLDIQLAEPHPAAENLFGAAWSACFMGAIKVAAAKRKISLPANPSVDATIDLLTDGGEFFLRARLEVSVPDVDRDVARELVDAAHMICPYSKAVKGNIEVEVRLVEPAIA